ncbi:hypothetical protein CVT24_007628 [Panaeolus cyanescens]|uniref:Uncharacterized protein n=1 Tax=Panaeolus cyanescens TaxID=181874 RepID=A0A409W576_9AGAR|nr:hypothetical protein CVT24_007628 [Panaeolus cyanescens]
MSTVITYDDRDFVVRYSQPAQGHHWTDQTSSQSYQGTLKLTNTRRASATVTFTGTSITVWGLISDRGTGADPVSSYSIDGGSSVTFAPGRTGSTQPRVQFFKSDPLENREHTLEIVNLVEGDFLWLDSFDVTRPVIVNNPAPAPPANSPSNTPSSTANRPASSSSVTPTSIATSSQTTASRTTTYSRSEVVTTIVQSTVIVDGSSTITSFSTSLSTTAIDAVITPSIPGSSDPSLGISPQAEKSGPPLGAIIGGVLGGLAVILLAVLVWLLFQRRRREQNLGVNPLSPPPTASAWTTRSAPGSRSQRQGHDPTPSFGSSSNLMSERSDPSSIQPFPRFIQPANNSDDTNIQGGGGAPHALGRLLPPPEPMGKRQVTNESSVAGSSNTTSQSSKFLQTSGHHPQPSFDSSVAQQESDISRLTGVSPVPTNTASLSTQARTMDPSVSASDGANSSVHGGVGYATMIIDGTMEVDSPPPAYRPKSTVYDSHAVQQGLNSDRKVS